MNSTQLRTYKQGAIAVDSHGKIIKVGPGDFIKEKFPHAKINDCGQNLIMPGFIDTHTHFPQMDMIGSYGKELLDWLETYTYPEEAQFNDQLKSRRVARRFFNELFQNGTTTAAIYSSPYALSTHELFSAAKSLGARAIIGKVHMNCRVPENFQVSCKVDIEETEQLITEWHNLEDRLHYAITPRFAPVCTEELLELLGQLRAKYPGVYVQTHFAENQKEIEWVAGLFPNDKSYLSIYERYNLLGDKTILGHGIYPTELEFELLKSTNSKISHCPTSNLFLGSGLFPLKKYIQNNITVGLATDIGAGTSFSLWQTMNEAYKIQKLQGNPISPAYLLYLATLGAAETLAMKDKIGSFEPGKYADFQVINWRNHRLIREKFDDRSPEENLFALITMGDDRLVDSTWINGKKVSL